MTDPASATEAGLSTRTSRVSVLAEHVGRAHLAIASLVSLVLGGLVGALLVILINSRCGPPI